MGHWSELNEWVTSYPEEMTREFFDFEKDVELRFGRRSERLSFSNLMISNQFGSRQAEMICDLRYQNMHHTWVGGSQHSMVSIGLYELCLSPRVAKS